MKQYRFLPGVVVIVLFGVQAFAAKHAADGLLTPTRATNHQAGYTIDTVGDTLGQAPAQNTRIIIKVYGADGRPIKPAQIALVDKGGAAIKPVFREDRKVGHEENTGLPVSLSPQAGTSGLNSLGAGVNLNKIFGPKGAYAYTKVDWPKSTFTADKRLQIVMPNGQAFVLPLTSLAQ